MDGRTDRRTTERADGGTDGRRKWWMEGKSDWWTETQRMDAITRGRTKKGGRTEGRTDGGRTDVWMHMRVERHGRM